uniref:Uncharacterized protein n=1 Tax=viral metagenome TaxID=1070528 RepID=A0A6M3IPN4_9ZZZZ
MMIPNCYQSSTASDKNWDSSTTTCPSNYLEEEDYYITEAWWLQEVPSIEVIPIDIPKKKIDYPLLKECIKEKLALPKQPFIPKYRMDRLIGKREKRIGRA